MPRPKKDGRYLNLYLDRALYEEFLRDEENTEREISFIGSLFFVVQIFSYWIRNYKNNRRKQK